MDIANATPSAIADEAMRRLLAWMLDVSPKRGGCRTAGIRCVAATWVVNPSSYGGRSLADLSRECGLSHATFSFHCARFSRAFNIVNRGQSHGWNRIPPVETHLSESQEHSEASECDLEDDGSLDSTGEAVTSTKESFFGGQVGRSIVRAQFSHGLTKTRI